MRHITDTSPTPPEPRRLSRAILLGRQMGEYGVHPAILALTRRFLAEPNDGTRLQQFLRIVRGRLA